MSMSLHVIGFAPPDEHWRRMKQIWDSCVAAKVTPPEEVMKFFGYEEPDDAGVQVELKPDEFKDDSREGFEIELAKIPKHVKTLRFYASW